MRRVLVTGCGIGNKFGVCDACNLDFTWLFDNISTILWADKICLPKDQFELTIGRHRNKGDIAISIMLQEMKENKLIELLDEKQFKTTPAVVESLMIQMDKDVVDMERAFPEAVRISEVKDNNFRNITIQNQEYCIPYIGSIYASLILADELNAHCLFNNHVYTFLKYKTGLDHLKTMKRAIFDTYNELFIFALPKETLPNYTFANEEQCKKCIKKTECSSDFEKHVLKYIRKILQYRDYDELHQLRNEIDKIVLSLMNDQESITTEEVKAELLQKQRKINKTMHDRFEKIKRWTSIATIASIPAGIINISTGNNAMAIASAAVLGAAKATEEAMKIYTSRKRWVGFLQN